MTKKAAFNADEWGKVVQGPILAGLRVATAERGGTIRESLAMGQAYRAARERQGESEFLDELVTSPPGLDPSLIQGGDLAARTSSGLREAVQLVESKTRPEEAEAYKRFILSVAQTVAGASKEGGFLGIGGKQVSPAEQVALDELSATLGTEAPPPPGTT
jgi:hypothetical protein